MTWRAYKVGGVRHWSKPDALGGRVVVVEPYRGWSMWQVLHFKEPAGHKGQEHFSNADSGREAFATAKRAVEYYSGRAGNKMGRMYRPNPPLRVARGGRRRAPIPLDPGVGAYERGEAYRVNDADRAISEAVRAMRAAQSRPELEGIYTRAHAALRALGARGIRPEAGHFNDVGFTYTERRRVLPPTQQDIEDEAAHARRALESRERPKHGTRARKGVGMARRMNPKMPTPYVPPGRGTKTSREPMGHRYAPEAGPVFKKGDRVWHDRYGAGWVQTFSPRYAGGYTYYVKFDAPGTPYWEDHAYEAAELAHQKVARRGLGTGSHPPRRNPPVSAISGGVPRGVWGRAVDALARYRLAGNTWVAAGRCRECPEYAAFAAAEREYEECLREADKWGRNEEQRAEWSRVFANTEGKVNNPRKAKRPNHRRTARKRNPASTPRVQYRAGPKGISVYVDERLVTTHSVATRLEAEDIAFAHLRACRAGFDEATRIARAGRVVGARNTKNSNPRRGVQWARQPGSPAITANLTRYARGLGLDSYTVKPDGSPSSKYTLHLPDGRPVLTLGLSESAAKREILRYANTLADIVLHPDRYHQDSPAAAVGRRVLAARGK